MQPIYLDYNATTPIRWEVFEAMLPFLRDHFGNPSSIHSFGRHARAAIDDTREKVAALLGATAKEIIFTSGGTESTNLAILGAARARRAEGRRIITCATEHHAVLHPFKALESEGFEVVILPVDGKGHIQLAQLCDAMEKGTVLVSLMSANNETGTRHPVEKIGGICREQGVLFHCDAVQSFGKERIDVESWNCDLLSIAAHKFYGPKGAGVLYAQSGTRLEPVLRGGAHENERRPGTENTAAIVGLGAAAVLADSEVVPEQDRLFKLTEKLWHELSSLSGTHRNGDPVQRIGNTLSVSFENCDGDNLLMSLDLAGLALSSGSACMVGSIQPSHVLQAMGVREDLIRATVRFSLGRDTQPHQISEVAERTRDVVELLRRKS